MRRAAEERAARVSAGTVDTAEVLDDTFPSEEPASAPIPDAFSTEAPVDRLAAAQWVDEALAPAAPVDPALEPAALESVALGTVRAGSLLAHLDARLATKTVIDDAMLPAPREQYRRLAATLHQAQRANGCKVVMVASAVAGEGKTLTAANLALTLSESYRRSVLLVDGDLRRPSLHTVFQVDGAPGLSDGLIAIDDPKLPLHRISSRLTVLPAGRPTSDPIGALTSERMRRLIDEAREAFDWVIIDTPPVGLLTDAALLSSMADGIVLVVKAESTPFDMVNRAVDAMGRDRVMGVVLNRAKEQPHRSSYDYSKYYGGSAIATQER
jgi:capsular exopolysaccharide synthesis family protein